MKWLNLLKPLVTALGVAGAIGLLRTAAAAESPTTEIQGSKLLALAITVNGVSTGSVIPVRVQTSHLEIHAEDLKALRIKCAPTAHPDAWIDLSTLKGVGYVYSEADQRLALRAADSAITPFEVSLNAAPTTDLASVHPITALLFDYNLYAATGSRISPAYASGALGGRLMTPVGTLVTTGLVNSSRTISDGAYVIPLDTYWRTVDPVAVRTYTVGDLISGALGWSNAYRLAGVQVQSAFQQRTDLITAALPTFSGSVAVPSTLDVYLNNIQVYAGQVPAGPFALSQLPNVSGGAVQIVTRDAQGQQNVVSSNYYYSPDILRQGVFAYSAEAGVLRRGYGTGELSYGDQPAGTVSMRYGVDNHLTLEGHSEAMPNLIEAGVGLDREIGGIGALSIAVAGSQSNAGTGVRVATQWDMQLGNLQAYIGTTRSSSGYMDIARRSEGNPLSPFAIDPSRSSALAITAYARQDDRAGMSFQVPFDRPTSVGFSYSALRAFDTQVKAMNLTASRNLGGRLNLYINGYQEVDRTRASAVSVGLNFAFGGGNNVSVNYTNADRSQGLEVSAMGATSMRQDQVAWSFYDREDDQSGAERRAQVSDRAHWGYVSAGVEQSGDAVRATGQATGSVIMGAGLVRPVDQIGDAFALVRNAGPGVEIRQDGATMANADANGTAFLPNLLPYRSTTISMDPVGLPVDWTVPSTEQRATSAYQNGVIIDFKAHKTLSAIVTFVDRAGKPIPPGYTARRSSGSTAVVGYSGETYMEDMAVTEHVSIDLGPAGVCQALVRFPQQSHGPVKLGPIPCLLPVASAELLASLPSSSESQDRQTPSNASTSATLAMRSDARRGLRNNSGPKAMLRGRLGLDFDSDLGRGPWMVKGSDHNRRCRPAQCPDARHSG